MTEIRDDFLVTDEADVTWLLRGDLQQSSEDLKGNKHRIARGPVREALKPVVGHGSFFIPKIYPNHASPTYSYEPYVGADEGVIVVGNNALTDGKTCGEIRKLIEWSET